MSPTHLYGPQHNLCVEIVGDVLHQLALDGQLTVEQGQVELELGATCRSKGGERGPF